MEQTMPQKNEGTDYLLSSSMTSNSIGPAFHTVTQRTHDHRAHSQPVLYTEVESQLQRKTIWYLKQNKTTATATTTTALPFKDYLTSRKKF